MPPSLRPTLKLFFDLVLAAFEAAAERSAAVLPFALRRDWREMAIVEAARCPTRRSAPVKARERFGDAGPSPCIPFS